jgi:hypothetical protein
MRLISVAAVILAMAPACGGGGSGNGLREATQDDLPELVLQREDIPPNFKLLSDTESGRGLQMGPDDFGNGAYVIDFERDPADAEVGEATCISNSATLWNTKGEARTALQTALNQMLQLEEADPFERLQIEEESGPDLGDDAWVVHLTGPSSTSAFCSSYEHTPSDEYHVGFYTGNVLGAVVLRVRERDADRAEAIRLATKQVDRIEAVLRQEGK